MRSRIRRPNVGSSRLGEKSKSTTERTFLFAVGASFACPRGRPTFPTFLTELGIPIKVPSRTRLQRTIVFSGMSVADQASQCWWAVIEEKTGMFFAHAVPYKGAGVEWVAQQMARDISKCGYHGRVVLQEPALQDLMGEVARLCGDLPTVLEASPVGDSQSNGFVERAVRSIEEMVRTHKIALEAKIGGKLNINHSAIGWMI